MAHYWTDFREYAAAAGLPADWSEQWNTGATWSIEAGNWLRQTHSSVNSRQASQWDDVPDTADVEILAKLRSSASANSGTYAGVAARIAGSAGAEDGMYCRLSVSSTGQRRISYGSYTGGTANSSNYPASGDVWNTNTWYWLRFRVNGTDVKYKLWEDGTAEPASWTQEATRSTPTAAGGAGVHCWTPNSNNDWAWFSVATGGDTALSPEDVMGDFFFDF